MKYTNPTEGNTLLGRVQVDSGDQTAKALVAETRIYEFYKFHLPGKIEIQTGRSTSPCG